MPSRYVLRVQVRPDRTPTEITQRLLGIAAETGADELCLFSFCEEYNDGHPTLDEVDAWLAATAPARTALAKAGVDVSLNPWHSVLHADRGRRLRPDQRWQTMVDTGGRAAAAQVCPLDPAWRDYYAAVLERYARSRPTTVWLDDDIRLHNHHPLRWGGCFCDRHLAEFARRAGIRTSRAELVAACTAPGEPHPWRTAWLSMWDSTQLELIASWRQVVEPYGVRLGLMSSGMAAHSAEGRDWRKWFAALDPGGAPVHRPHYFGYRSGTGGPGLVYGITALDANRAVQPPGTDSFPEVENSPYGRWTKSFREQFAQLCLAHVLGSTGLAISVHDFLDNDPQDEPAKHRFLAGVRPTVDWVADTFGPGGRTVGVGVAWSQACAEHRRLPAGAEGDWGALAAPFGGWAGWLLGSGAAVSLRGDQPVNAVSASAVWAADDARLRRWLTGGLLLDGPAAQALAERGYAAYTGLTDCRSVTQDELHYSIEQCPDPAFALRAGAYLSVNQVNSRPFCTTLVQGTPAPDAVVASTLLDARQQPVGHGLVLFRNELGGRVATVPWHADVAPHLTEQRVGQLIRVLDWLGGEHAVASGHPWLLPVVLQAGDRWRIAVFNGSPDDTEQVRLRLPAGMPEPTTVTHVTGTGARLPAHYADGSVHLAGALRQWEFLVLTA